MRSLIWIGLVTLFLTCSCSKNNKTEQSVLSSVSTKDKIDKELELAVHVFQHLYLPVEMSNMFKDIDHNYNPIYLTKTENAENLLFSNEMALAMGVYGVNLGYVRLYNEWGKANEYIQLLKNLSENLGISEEVFFHLSEYFENPVYNKDTLVYLANQIFQITDYSLQENGRERVSGLIILGGWLEAIRMSIDMINQRSDLKLFKKICEQDESLNSIINLLSIEPDDELLTHYIDLLSDIQNFLGGLKAVYIHIEAEPSDQFSYETAQNYLNKINTVIERMLDFEY